MPKRGEVWRVDLEPRTGSEQGDIRPPLVISSNSMNETAARSIVVPITRTRKYIPTWLEIDPPEGGLKKPGSLLCDQLRSISHARFSGRMGTVSHAVLLEVERLVKYVLEFD